MLPIHKLEQSGLSLNTFYYVHLCHRIEMGRISSRPFPLMGADAMVSKPHLFFSRTLALLEARRDGKSSHTRLEAQTGGAGRVGQAFCSALLPGGGGIIWRMREQEVVLRGPPG